MPNLNGSPHPQASSGVVKSDYAHWVDNFGQRLPVHDAQAMEQVEFVYYSGYCAAYNRMVQAFRQDPATMAMITRVMMQELNKYFETTQQPR